MDEAKGEQQLYWAETLAILYIIAPLFIFFAFFVRLEIAIPAGAFIAYIVYELLRRTSWSRVHILRWQSLYFFFIALLWVGLSSGIGGIAQNSDWSKHNMIVLFLSQHSWPPSERFTHFGDLALRYYIGWHLIPSATLKVIHSQLPTLATWAWSALGVFIFFNFLPNLVGSRAAAIAAPLVFIAFGGMDIVGTSITQYSGGPDYHFEWWAGWAQFSSNTAALFWSPQQAIPAWTVVAILMRSRHECRLLPYLVLLMAATLLWSPFITIGLAPFLLALAIRHDFRQVVFGWRAIVSVFLLAVPIGLYLTAGFGSIPHGYIATDPCTAGAICFSWPSYILFLLLEIGAPLAILFLRNEQEQGFLIAAALTLCLVPLYRIGLLNDFAMRASLPALAVLAILCAKLIASPKPYPTAALLVLLAAAPSVLPELARGFLQEEINISSADIANTAENRKWWIDQSFAPKPIWILRHGK